MLIKLFDQDLIEQRDSFCWRTAQRVYRHACLGVMLSQSFLKKKLGRRRCSKNCVPKKGWTNQVETCWIIPLLCVVFCLASTSLHTPKRLSWDHALSAPPQSAQSVGPAALPSVSLGWRLGVAPLQEARLSCHLKWVISSANAALDVQDVCSFSWVGTASFGHII